MNAPLGPVEQSRILSSPRSIRPLVDQVLELSKIIEVCKNLPPDILPVTSLLPESNIIRAPDSNLSQIRVYKINGFEFAYIGNAFGANWGDTVILTKDTEGAYTDVVQDCPLLFMHLEDYLLGDIFLLTHIYRRSMDLQVEHLISKLSERQVIPHEIVFSSKRDVDYLYSYYELCDFANGQEVKIVLRENPITKAVLTKKGWCIMDANQNRPIGSSLWKNHILE